METGVWQLISGRQDRMEKRLEGVEDELDGIPELRASVDKLITAIYTAIPIIVAAAMAVIFFGPK